MSVILLFGSLGAVAQEGRATNRWILFAGPGFLARQDRVFSPQVHRDLSFLNAGTGFIREGNWYQRVELGIALFNPMVTEPYTFYMDGEARTALPHQFIFTDLDYQFGKNLSGAGKLKLTAGGLFTADIQALNYVYGRVGNFGYFAALGAGFFLHAGYPAGKRGWLTSTLRVPAISWLARSPYLVNDDAFIENQSSHSGIKSLLAFLADGRLVSLNELQSFNVEAGYTFSFSERLGAGVRYRLEFIHASRPRNLLSFQHGIELTAHINF